MLISEHLFICVFFRRQNGGRHAGAGGGHGLARLRLPRLRVGRHRHQEQTQGWCNISIRLIKGTVDQMQENLY